jgi:hypothetical protein
VFCDDVRWLWDLRVFSYVTRDACCQVENEDPLFDWWDVISSDPIPERLVGCDEDWQPVYEFFVCVFHICWYRSTFQKQFPCTYGSLIDDWFFEND